MSALSIAEVLEKVADKLSAPGAWGQGGTNPSQEGCHCAATAIYDETRGSSYRKVRIGAYNYLLTLAGVSFGAYRSNELLIWNWNDAPDRTQDEVVAKLREAAALALREGR